MVKEVAAERLTDVQTWYVVFDVSRGGSWFAKLLPWDFQHVILFRESAAGSLMLNPMSQLIAVKEYEINIIDVIRQEIEQGVTAVLQYTVYAGAHYKGWPPEPMTCVSIAKKVLGIRAWVFTPYGLYKELLRAGAIAIKPY